QPEDGATGESRVEGGEKHEGGERIGDQSEEDEEAFQTVGPGTEEHGARHDEGNAYDGEVEGESAAEPASVEYIGLLDETHQDIGRGEKYGCDEDREGECGSNTPRRVVFVGLMGPSEKVAR